MSLVLARILGLYLLAFGGILLVNTERLRSAFQSAFKEESFLLLGALLSILCGSVFIGLHNVWGWQWAVLITILGWWAFVKGIALLLCPRMRVRFLALCDRPVGFYRVIGLVWTVVGLFLLVKSFG